MATFLMIHGAWHGGWSFEPLRAGLEARGHRLIAPDLPGVGGDDATVAAVTLGGWADHVAALARDAAPVILCGHSRGGIVISEAAERAPESISALVYISAFLIPSGRSLDDMTKDEPRSAEFDAGLSPTAGGAALALTGEAAHAAFYHRAPDAARRDAMHRLLPEPIAPLFAPLALSEGGFGRVPRHYIECSDDQAILLRQQRAMQAVLPCASVTTLDSDHSPFLTCPDALVEALDRIAASVMEGATRPPAAA